MPAIAAWCWDIPEVLLFPSAWSQRFYVHHRRPLAEHNLGLLIPFEVWRVGRQVEQLAAPPLDQLPDPRPLVRGEVVHHEHLPRSKRRSEHVLQVGLEDRAGGRALHGHARPHPREAHARQQRDVAAPVARRLAARSLSRSGPSVQWGERGVRPALVHEHQALRVDLAGGEQPPGGPQELVALSRSQRSFFRLHPKRLSILLTVESLTLTPATRSRNSRLSGKIAAGRSSRSTSRSFLAGSSSFGFEPGRLFGASERPSRAVAT